MQSTDLQKLEVFLRPLCDRGIALAFSGGVDSSLLLAVLMKLHKEKPFPFMVLSAVSTLQSARDAEEIQAAAEFYGIQVHFVRCDVLALPEVKGNTPLRCYHCKKYIFRSMLDEAAKEGIGTLLEGSHADDLKSYRPGRKALAELQVVSPLEILGFSKSAIRAMAKMLGVKTAERPSSPCLATRFDYGETLTEEKLHRAAGGEKLLRRFLPENADLRLRIHGTMGRIEVNGEFFQQILNHRSEILEELEKLGFERVVLDIAGFASGSFDRIRKEN